VSSASRVATVRVGFVSERTPSPRAARSTSAAALFGLAGEPELRSAAPARNQRPRSVDVSSHRLSSQPATFGGRKSR
jgi:hypothetical protein